MRVSILYKHLPHYRIDFFNGLRAALAQKCIDLNLFYGKNVSVVKQDEFDLEWAQSVPNRYYGFGNWSLCWQKVPEDIYRSDLIVLMQENKIVSNHVLLAKARARHCKVAFWDHGLNLQASRNSIGNNIKRMYATSVFWWFAYTEGVKKQVSSMGFPGERITVVQNAIDTRFLREQAAQIDDCALRTLRLSLGIGSGPVGLFCGGMYKEKRLLFLLEACRQLRTVLPGFEMMFIGAGPDSHFVTDVARECPWIHYIGPKFGVDVVPFMKMADAFLMPGAVGLNILDAFALQKPFLTMQYPYHGPEIDYLVNRENGIITENSLEAFVAGVVEVLTSDHLLRRIQLGCREAALTYTVEHMVENYARGIESAVAAR